MERERNTTWENPDELKVRRLLSVPEELGGEAESWRALRLEIEQKQRRSALAALNLPAKEIGLIVEGSDRAAKEWRVTAAYRELVQAVRTHMLVILYGPVGSGKSSAACRVLADLCRVEIRMPGVNKTERREQVDVWDEGLYLRVPDYARLADWEEDKLGRIWEAKNLVLDDLGEEQQLGEKAVGKVQLLLTKRDDVIRRGTRTIITTNLASKDISERYGDRVFDRLREMGKWIRCDERVRPVAR